MIVQGRRLATRPWCPLPKEVAAKAQLQGNGGQGHTPQPKPVATKAQVTGISGQGSVPQPKKMVAKAQVPGNDGRFGPYLGLGIQDTDIEVKFEGKDRC